jgi:hypothetical protein
MFEHNEDRQWRRDDRNPFAADQSITVNRADPIGLKRAKAAGEVFGRPPTLTEAQRALAAVREQIAVGTSISALAKR